MKKKIIISIMVVVMALSVLFALTACERTEVPTNGIRAGMTAGEIVEYLLKTDIKSFTLVMTRETSDGTMTMYSYFTEKGSCDRSVSSAGETYEFEIVDNGRFVEIDIDGQNSAYTVTDLQGNEMCYTKPAFDMQENVAMLAAYVYLGDYIEKNELVVTGDMATKYYIEGGNLVFEVGNEGKTTLCDINNTTLPLPEEFKDYNNLPVTRTNLEYTKVSYEREDGETVVGAELSNYYNKVEECIIPESVVIDGETLPVVSVNITNFARKVTLPKTIRKVGEIFNLAENYQTPVWFNGTVEEWNANKVEYGTWCYGGAIVHCTNGDVIAADANELN